MDSLELTDEQLSLAKVMVDDYAPDDEDEEELKDSIAEKLKSNVVELSDEQLRFFHIMVDDYTPAWDDEDEEELKDSIAEKLPFI